MTKVSLSVWGFVPFGAFAIAVTSNTPALFLPFLLTFTGRGTVLNAVHCAPVSDAGVLRANDLGCDLNLSVASWLGGVQPGTVALLMQSRTFKVHTLLHLPSVSQVGSPSAHSRVFGFLSECVPSRSSTT